MCGRTCLSLNPEDITLACKYKYSEDTKKIDFQYEQKSDIEQLSNDDNFVTPEWRAEYNCGRVFIPSYNIAPTDICPVIVSSSHFNHGETKLNKRIIVPMMWGIIPYWHRGDYRKHGLSNNHNCRLEYISQSKLYRRSFDRGQRCVILSEGFYEWQTTKDSTASKRAPYFIYVNKSENKNTSNNISLLNIAGIFDIWENDNGDKILAFSVITLEASEPFSSVHHRMPAILETDQQINDWLDYERVSSKEAMKMLTPSGHLKWHRVSNMVNNSRIKTQECNKPLELTKLVPQNKIMAAWLNKRKFSKIPNNEEPTNDVDEKDTKRPCCQDSLTHVKDAS